MGAISPLLALSLSRSPVTRNLVYFWRGSDHCNPGTYAGGRRGSSETFDFSIVLVERSTELELVLFRRHLSGSLEIKGRWSRLGKWEGRGKRSFLPPPVPLIAPPNVGTTERPSMARFIFIGLPCKNLNSMRHVFPRGIIGQRLGYKMAACDDEISLSN